MLNHFFDAKASKGLIGTLGIVSGAAVSIAASPNWMLSLLIFSLMMSIGGLFVQNNKRFAEIKQMHVNCEERLKKIIAALFQNGHRGAKRRKVDDILKDILNGSI